MIDRITDLKLFKEMLEYSPIQFKTEKAAKVWMNCVRAGKFKLAQKIENKWAKPMRSDLVMAFQYSLMAFAQQNKQK